jgi:transposase
VYQWRRKYRAGGETALASKGPGRNACKLDEAQLSRLRAALDLGPTAYGWKQDQRWTLARVTALIARLFHVHCTLRVVPAAPDRVQPAGPAHRAAERDKAAIAEWRAVTWVRARG